MNPRILITVMLFSAGFSHASSITGRAFDAKGRPVPHLRLILTESTAAERHSTVTDGRGEFSVSLPAGEYVLLAPDGASERVVARVKLREGEERSLELRVFPDDSVEIEPALPPTRRADSGEELDPSLREIREYRVVSGESKGAAASGARSLSETVNPFAAQKRGRVHGSLYEFHRNDNFDARNFFDLAGEPLPEYKRNQFGGTLGLNVSKRLTFFGTYDGVRIIQGSTLLAHVPTPEMKRGDFSSVSVTLTDPATGLALPDNVIPDSRIHPVAKKLLGVFPDPNNVDPSRNFVNSQPVVHNRDSSTYRVDYQTAGGSVFYGRYAETRGSGLAAHPLPTFGATSEDAERVVSLSFSQRATTSLTLGYGVEFQRDTYHQRSVNADGDGLLMSLGIEGLEPPEEGEDGYPDFRFADYASFGDAAYPVNAVSNRYSADASASYTPANHSIRVGGSINFYQANDYRSDGLRKGRFTFNGYYTGDSFADFLLGLPDSAAKAVGSDRADLRRRSWSLYARDQWRIGRRLTISPGVTYNYVPPYRYTHNQISGFYPLVFEPPLTGGLISPGTPEAEAAGLDAAGEGGLVFPDRNDWAPNLGIAYRPFASNRLIIRSSYALTYSPLGRDSYVAYLGRNYPYYYVISALSPVETPLLDLSVPFQNATVNEIGIRGIETRLRTTYVQRWNLTTQAELRQRWYVEAGYDADKGTHVPRLMAANAPLPGPGLLQPRRPNPQYGRFTIQTGAGSYTRNSMFLAMERRLERGIAVKASYLWDVSIGDTYRSYPSNPRDLRAERAVSQYPPGHRLSVSYILDLPFGNKARFLSDAEPWLNAMVGGWRLSGISRFQQGSRFNVVQAGDANNDGAVEDRPDRVGPANLPASERSVDRWFATEHFTAPAAYSFGNAGRNVLLGPPYANWDLSLIKQVRVSAGQLLEFRLELFNAFNHTNFEVPSAVLGTSTFGQIFGAARAREMEVAVRYSF
jgi:hypothetical protein